MSPAKQVYAQYHHKRHGSSGVFWEGRFKSKPVEIGESLVRCGRYIERNPVRAGLAQKAWDYKWSSACFHVSGRKDGLTDENRYIWAEENPSVAGRKEYAEALQGSTDDEWMRRQMMRSEDKRGRPL